MSGHWLVQTKTGAIFDATAGKFSMPSYASRRSQFKSTAYRSRKMSRPDKYRRAIRNRTSYRRSRPRLALGQLGRMDPTRSVLNTTTRAAAMFSRTVSGVAWGFGSSSPSGANFILTFDPSGTYGTYSGSIGSGTLPAMPDWISIIGIFNEYRVKAIRLTWKAVTDTETSLDTDSPTILERYNYRKSITSTTSAAMRQLVGTVRKTFTAANPLDTYTVYPKCIVELQNTGVLSAQGAEIRSHDWTDVNYPCQLYGYQAVLDEATDAHTTMLLDITYEVEFRYHH